jgi:hypothetical protein
MSFGNVGNEICFFSIIHNAIRDKEPARTWCMRCIKVLEDESTDTSRSAYNIINYTLCNGKVEKEREEARRHF